MFTQHQAMFFARKRASALRYSLTYRLSADYDFVASFLAGGVRFGPARALKLNFPVCRFALGGKSWKYRTEALAEDYRIRRTNIGLPFWKASALYVAHLMHTYIKSALPEVARKARYDEDDFNRSANV
jgi:hypothetical protein